MLNMFPNPSINDVANSSCSETELLPYFIVKEPRGFPDFTDFQSISFGDLSCTAPLPICHSSLLNCIQRVLSWSPKEKVVRVHAEINIALVAHEHAFRDFAIVNLPRKTMGNDRFPAGLACAGGNDSVEGSLSASPKPARICFVNISPKSFLNWNFLSVLKFALIGAAMLFPLLKEPAIDIEFAGANGTFSLHHKRVAFFFGVMGSLVNVWRSLISEIYHPYNPCKP